MDCKVSVVVPVYKVMDRMIKTLESLEAQTFKEFEVLFIDDGSPDDSSEFADNYLKNSDVNYKIIKKENGGVSSARNLGIEEAKGEYIQFLDSDDYIDKNMLKNMYEKAIEHDSDIVYSGYTFEESNGKEISNNILNLKEGEFSGKKAALGLIYGYTHTHIMATLFRRGLLIDNDIRFDVNRKFAEDIAFEIKAYAHSRRVYCLNRIYSHYVKWDQSVTNNISLNFLDIYYSNVETLDYIRKVFDDNELEKAMIHNRIPAAIVNIFAAFSTKKELIGDMYEFISKKDVREYLKQYKVNKLEIDRVRYFILSKMILHMPKKIETYYSRRQ